MAETKKTPAKKTTTAKKPQDRKPKTAPKSQGISITASRDEIPVHLVGIDYKIKPPKAMVSLKFAQEVQGLEGSQDPSQLMQALSDWTLLVFGEEEGQQVLDRLEQNDDDLDISHLMNLLQQVTEYSSGNPTT